MADSKLQSSYHFDRIFGTEQVTDRLQVTPDVFCTSANTSSICRLTKINSMFIEKNVAKINSGKLTIDSISTVSVQITQPRISRVGMIQSKLNQG